MTLPELSALIQTTIDTHAAAASSLARAIMDATSSLPLDASLHMPHPHPDLFRVNRVTICENNKSFNRNLLVSSLNGTVIWAPSSSDCTIKSVRGHVYQISEMGELIYVAKHLGQAIADWIAEQEKQTATANKSSAALASL